MDIASVGGVDDFIGQGELRAVPRQYKRIAGSTLEEFATASVQPTSSDLFDDKRPGR